MKEATIDTNLQIENLLKLAFQRTKERFLPYFVIFLLSIFASGMAIIVLVFVAGIFSILFNKNIAALIPTLLVIALGLIYALFYISAWMKLGMVSVLTQTEKLGAIETLKSVKPLVNGFIWYSAISSLFMLSLLPFGLVTFLIIYFLWQIWSGFVVFVT